MALRTFAFLVNFALLTSATPGESAHSAHQNASAFAISSTLGDHMVLQRAPAHALVWGFAKPGTKVTSVFDSITQHVVTGPDGVWRVPLRPTEAGGPYHITVSAAWHKTVVLSDVMFGDVYICGGQSNMQFSVGGNENAAAYEKEADDSLYHNIRLFTVGEGTQSDVPLMNLKTILEPWSVASSKSVSDGSAFNYFSGVCWFFGKNLHKALGGSVPIGLISNNWGGTPVEHWVPPNSTLPCGHASDGVLYNAMIFPYTVGPMAVHGFTWYQGEADVTGDPAKRDQNNNYTCTQAVLVKQWRKDFGPTAANAFFGAVQLSTWTPGAAGNLLLAQMREQQLATEDLVHNFACVTNADFGQGADIHPPYKQHSGARLANAALAITYGQNISWRSPTYAKATPLVAGALEVSLNDVLDAGLVLKDPFNAKTAGNCTALNKQAPLTCAWAALQFDDAGGTWVNASISLGSDKKTMVLQASPPAGAMRILASSYGWGAIPILSVYRADMDGQDGQLPVLPWNRTLPSPIEDRVSLVI